MARPISDIFHLLPPPNRRDGLVPTVVLLVKSSLFPRRCILFSALLPAPYASFHISVSTLFHRASADRLMAAATARYNPRIPDRLIVKTVYIHSCAYLRNRRRDSPLANWLQQPPPSPSLLTIICDDPQIRVRYCIRAYRGIS